MCFDEGHGAGQHFLPHLGQDDGLGARIVLVSTTRDKAVTLEPLADLRDVHAFQTEEVGRSLLGRVAKLVEIRGWRNLRVN